MCDINSKGMNMSVNSDCDKFRLTFQAGKKIKPDRTSLPSLKLDIQLYEY